MYVCNCNPISDKTVQGIFEAAAEKGERVSVGEIYKACTAGKQPVADCKQCVPTLVDMVKDHNRKIIPILPA